MPRFTEYKHRISALALVTGLTLAAPMVQAGETAQVPPLFGVELGEPFPEAEATFGEARKLILDKYYSPTITDEALYRGAIDGMLRAVSPPHNKTLSRLFTPEEYGRFTGALSGTRSTLGAQLKFNRDDGSLTVTEIEPGSPADGVLEVHDRIMRVDGKPLRKLSLDALNALIDGPPGTRLMLTVVRDIVVMQVPLTKSAFKARNLEVQDLPGGIRHVRIKRFYNGVSGDLKEVLPGVGGESLSKLVLDLRGNPGGVFLEGIRVAELFLNARDVLLLTQQRPTAIKRYVSSNEAPIAADVILLVDDQTASAAEILAAALRDHGVARIVGTSTFGKATMEQTFPLGNGHHMKFIIGAMYGPRGVSWFDKGLKPDFYSETGKALDDLGRLAPAQRLKQDLALATAFKLLQAE